jgi:uncharacterized protein
MSDQARKVRNLMLFGLFAVFIGLIAIVLGLSYQEVRIWVYPVRIPVEPQPDDSPFSEVTLQTADDLTIYGWYAPSKTGQVILMFHGLGSNRDHFMEHADAYMDSGYGLMSIDFRNSGNSDGDVTSMGYYEINEARAAYDFLLAQEDVQQIVLMGHSMGAGIASQLMQEVDADGLVMIATFADFYSIVRAGVVLRGFPPSPITEILVTMAGTLGQADWYSLRPIDNLASIDKPMLLLHGTDDLTIPIDNAYRIVEANPQIKLVAIESGGHADLDVVAPELYRREIMDYLDSVFE